jgi:CheY-like chemotaxis protein
MHRQDMISSKEAATSGQNTGLTSSLSMHGSGEPTFAAENPLRILLAEDDYINRRVFTLFLQHLGYEPSCVENGLECYNLVLAESFDLILTDIEMPQMTGLECAGELRRAGVKVPIIAISASTRENISFVCRSAGMDGYLPKPLPPQELRRTLMEVYLRKVGKTVAAQERRPGSSQLPPADSILPAESRRKSIR